MARQIKEEIKKQKEMLKEQEKAQKQFSLQQERRKQMEAERQKMELEVQRSRRQMLQFRIEQVAAALEVTLMKQRRREQMQAFEALSIFATELKLKEQKLGRFRQFKERQRCFRAWA